MKYEECYWEELPSEAKEAGESLLFVYLHIISTSIEKTSQLTHHNIVC